MAVTHHIRDMPAELLFTTEEQMSELTSTSFRVNAAFLTVIAVATPVVTVFALRTLYRRCIFPSSTRILLLASLFFANAHEATFTFSHLELLLRSFKYSNDASSIMITSTYCLPLNLFLTAAYTGMVYVQVAFSFDRLLSTILGSVYAQFEHVLGCLLLLVVLTCALAFPMQIYMQDAPEEMMSSCLGMPSYTTESINRLLFICILLIASNIIVNIFLIVINTRLDKKSRFNVTTRYEKRETLLATQAVCLISIVQFATLMISTVSLLVLRSYHDQLAVSTFFKISAWSYTAPYAAVSMPILIVVFTWSVGKTRKKNIKLIIGQRETGDQHVNNLKSMWDKQIKK